MGGWAARFCRVLGFLHVLCRLTDICSWTSAPIYYLLVGVVALASLSLISAALSPTHMRPGTLKNSVRPVQLFEPGPANGGSVINECSKGRKRTERDRMR